MSRTKHHRSKNHHCGEDLWSNRPCSQYNYSSFNKKLTRQKERAISKQALKRILKTDNIALIGRFKYAYKFD